MHMRAYTHQWGTTEPCRRRCPHAVLHDPIEAAVFHTCELLRHYLTYKTGELHDNSRLVSVTRLFASACWQHHSATSSFLSTSHLCRLVPTFLVVSKTFARCKISACLLELPPLTKLCIRLTSTTLTQHVQIASSELPHTNRLTGGIVSALSLT